MSLRTRMLAVADRVRAIPARLDERPTTVTIRTRTWAGGLPGREGATTHVDVVLTPTPKVREISQREIVNSGGRYQAGDLRVGPITPAYTGGGYTEAQLAPVVTSDAVEVVYVLAGYISGEYARVDLSQDRSHSWFLTLTRTRRTP